MPRSLRTTLVTTGLVATALVMSFAPAAFARDLPPAPDTFVFDEAAWLSDDEEARLSRDLMLFERESSNQIVVAVFRTLDGEDLADFSQRVAQSWKIGQANRDNGILLAVFVEERSVYIEVGYGLEPVVTDAVAARIRDRVLAPAFREGRYAEGIFAAVDSLKAASRGEFLPLEPVPPTSGGLSLKLLLILLVLFVVAALLLAKVMGTAGSLVLGPPDWGQSGRAFRSMNRGGGGFRGGSSSRGGSFRGGGGSFGGGGARGRW
jgi:uncharacterized protein